MNRKVYHRHDLLIIQCMGLVMLGALLCVAKARQLRQETIIMCE